MSSDRDTSQHASINDTVAFNTFQQYSWINNAQFYPLVPTYYYDYYNRFVRQYFYWYDGFNPTFHNQDSGIFSSRLAFTICNKLSGLINGGSLMYDAPYKLSNYKIKYKEEVEETNALEFMEQWSYDVNLTNKNNTAVEYSLAGGDSCYKLNSDGTDVYPTVLRKDNYVVDTDFKGTVTGFMGVVYTYTKMTKNTSNDDNSRQDFYYLLEERKIIEGKPMYRIFVKVGYGNLTTNKDISFETIQEVKWESLSKDVRKAVKDNYPTVKLGDWNELPLKSLGIYLMKASDGISFLPQLPFGESILSNQIANLQTYDYLKSIVATELYLGRGRVLLPESMQNPNKINNVNQYDGLDSGMYNLMKYIDAQNQKPIPIQFEMRADALEKLEKLVLRDVAMGLSISERTLAGFLTDGSEKATAREISVDDATSTFVENKRTLYKKPINLMLQDVLDFYEFPDTIVVRFSRVGLNNMNDAVQQVTVLKQNKLIDRYTALNMIYVDKNEKQIRDMMKLIDEEEEKAMKLEQSKVEPQGTSDEDFEQKNNTDINHVKSVE
jgi:hypothetical protein